MRPVTCAMITTAGILTALLLAGEAQAGEQLGVEIRIISAQPGPDHIDTELENYQEDFQKLPYRSYRLLDFHAKKLRAGEWLSMQFPGPKRRLLKVQFRDNRDGKHRMRIAIEGLNFRTSIRIPDDGTVIVGGPQHGKGVILLAVTARQAT